MRACHWHVVNACSYDSRNRFGGVKLAETQQVNQSKTVKGKVIDDHGDPLIGVTVAVKGQSGTGCVTDVDGNFSLSVPSGATLVFSYVGYTTVTVKTGGQSTINITMKSDAQELDEVVAIGYGTMKKRDLTGATTSLRSDAITSVMASNPIEALQGKSSGVAVFTNNQPGEAPTLRIRGSASINAGTDPLYVVDGFALTDGNMNTQHNGTCQHGRKDALTPYRDYKWTGVHRLC